LESASILLLPFHFYFSPTKLRKQFWQKSRLELSREIKEVATKWASEKFSREVKTEHLRRK